MNIRKADIPAALQSLRPGAQWCLRGDEYSGLEWMDTAQACPTEDEINAEITRLDGIYPLEACKREAKKRIADTDWSVLPDVALANKSDFEAYRSALRAFIITPAAEPQWPVEPEPVWEQATQTESNAG
jgi:hypothetical protein